jgi:hypothetical protein
VPRYLGLLVALCALSACGSSSATSSRTTGNARCGDPAARTLAASGRARVYVSDHVVYGCAPAGGGTYRLGGAGRCLASHALDAVAVAGPLIAYAVSSCGVDMSTTKVLVRRLTDGAILATSPSVSVSTGPESIQSVSSIVVNSAGHVAWIGSSRSILAHRRVVEVLEQAGHGLRVLDSDRSIAPGSLRLQGTTLSWKQDGASRTVTLS